MPSSFLCSTAISMREARLQQAMLWGRGRAARLRQRAAPALHEVRQRPSGLLGQELPRKVPAHLLPACMQRVGRARYDSSSLLWLQGAS